MQFPDSDSLNRYVADLGGGTVILSFSTGKDSIAAWLVMRKYFKRIIPYYLYTIPGLEFIERSLRYYEDFFETKILRMPQPSFYRMLNDFVLQAPENCAIIEDANLPEFTTDDVTEIIRVSHGLSDRVYTATGVRARDSLVRWAAVKKYGPLNQKRRQFFPIFDYNKAQMVKTLRESGVKLPVDYRMFGRSFDGIDYRFLVGLKEHYPRDYARILEFFPMAELELKRIEYRKAYYEIEEE